MKTIPLLLFGSLLAFETYSATTAAPAATLHQIMDKVVRVQTQVIWDVSNNATDDNGNPAASKLKAADWGKMADASAKVEDALQTLLKAEHIVVAAPGQKLEGENPPEGYGAKQVQGLIDKNPAAFKAFTTQLSKSMNEISAATKTKNAGKLLEVAGRIDEECENCHMVFWYPNQKVPP